jgi:isopentenyl diphosphate isomerase/L-lactate dehydrogenase-like FMN-dependent dehydrogenase
VSFEQLLVDPSSTKAWRKLVALAAHPFDLTTANALSPERISAFQATALDFTLLYGTQRVTEEVVDALQALADQCGAVAQFAAMTSEQVEDRYVELLASVKESLSIPLSVKIGPFFSGLPRFAGKLEEAGADGLVLFNRFLEPDIDLEELGFRPNLHLSTRNELRLPLRWIAILRDQLQGSIAATSGVHFTEDVIKALLVGADVVQMASVLLQRGPGYLKQMLEELQSWLEEKDYESVEQLKGSMSRIRCSDPSELERANYMKALISYTDSV